LKTKNFLVGLLLTVFLSACSSSGALKVTQPLAEPITAGKSVCLSIKVAEKAEQGEDTQNVTRLLKEYLYTKLVTDGVFQKTVLPPEKADYDLEVNVLGVRVVSNTTRLMVGVMAGPSSIETEAKLQDSGKNKIITVFNAEGNSASHPMSSAAGYENAVRETADHIIKGLKQ